MSKRNVLCFVSISGMVFALLSYFWVSRILNVFSLYVSKSVNEAYFKGEVGMGAVELSKNLGGLQIWAIVWHLLVFVVCGLLAVHFSRNKLFNTYKNTDGWN